MKRIITSLLMVACGYVHAADNVEEQNKIRELAVSQRQLECIAHAMYHETQGNPDIYGLGVGNVIINRTLKSDKKPCRIIARNAAFPWYSRSGLNANVPREYFQLAFDLLIGRLTGTMKDVTNGATHFNQVGWGHQPNWTKSFPVTLRLKKMNFYKETLKEGTRHGF